MKPEVSEACQRVFDYINGGSLEGILEQYLHTILDDHKLLHSAVMKHHGQKADDRCIEDDTELYQAAGLPTHDPRVGNPFEMIHNCWRFIKNRCQEGGPWISYAELEVVAMKYDLLKEEHLRLINTSKELGKTIIKKEYEIYNLQDSVKILEGIIQTKRETILKLTEKIKE